MVVADTLGELDVLSVGDGLRVTVGITERDRVILAVVVMEPVTAGVTVADTVRAGVTERLTVPVLVTVTEAVDEGEGSRLEYEILQHTCLAVPVKQLVTSASLGEDVFCIIKQVDETESRVVDPQNRFVVVIAAYVLPVVESRDCCAHCHGGKDRLLVASGNSIERNLVAASIKSTLLPVPFCPHASMETTSCSRTLCTSAPREPGHCIAQTSLNHNGSETATSGDRIGARK